VARELGEVASLALARLRLEEADRIVAETVTPVASRDGRLAARLGELSMDPVWGLPVLLGVLAGVYLFVGKLGAQTAVDLLEGRLFGKILTPAAIRLVDALARFPHSHHVEDGATLAAYGLEGAASPLARLLHDLLVGEYGIVTMAFSYSIGIILPVVGTFFVAFGLLEDSGYLPRLAVMTDRLLRAMGLNGKAVLPMILGLGCDTMATLTTRILETRKERLLVILLLALAVPCSAQLGVILGLLGALGLRATDLWAGVVLASLVLVGVVAARVLPGERADFLLEIPPLRVPRFGNILAKTVARVEWYLREAVPLFVLGTLILFVLDRLGLLAGLERLGEPLVAGVLGLPPRAADAFLVGFLRRDYGAAGLFHLFETGALDPKQAVVSLVTITLFVPCLANLLVIVKEQGARVAVAIAAFVFPFAFAVGGLVRLVLGRVPLL
jgi:ferrous iron transport protein B